MRSWRSWVAGALLPLSLPAAAGDDLQFNRVEAPVAVTRGAVSTPPGVRGALLAGDQLRTGPGGRVSVALADGGAFTLAGDSGVRIVATAPPDPPGRTVLLEMTLERGAVHVDARKLEQKAPADVRLTLSRIKVRLYGTDAWAESSAAGDELCLVSGAAEIDTPAGHRRLDEPGECLRATARGVERVAAQEVGPLAPRLALTTFDDDYATRYLAQQVRAEGRARPRLAELASPAGDGAAAALISPPPAVPAAPAPAAATPAPPVPAPPARPAAAAAPGPREWRLVLAGAGSRAQAEARARQLRARGWNIDIVEVPAGAGARYRLLAGHYATRAEASVAQAKTHKLADLRDAWIIELPRARR